MFLNTFNILRREILAANNIIVVTYLTYLLISVTLTISVARTLYKRGAASWLDTDHLQQFIHAPNRVQPLIKEALRLLNVVEAGQPEQPIRRAAVADGDCQERKLIEFERVAENPDPAATYLANCCCRFVRKDGMDGVAGR